MKDRATALCARDNRTNRAKAGDFLPLQARALRPLQHGGETVAPRLRRTNHETDCFRRVR
jgi:hypothetical protein